MKRIVLIDADINLFRISQQNELEVAWDSEIVTMTCNIPHAKEVFDETIKGIVKKVSADDYLLCISGDNNFRKVNFPTYKSNRKSTRKPMGYKELKEHAIANHPHKIYDEMEADDVMGILSTKTNPPGIEYVIHSDDKDMKTIPGKLWDRNSSKIITVSEVEANRFLYTQVLTGDTVDGYKGCPSIGKTKAQKALATCTTELEMRNAALKLYEKVYKDTEVAKNMMIEQAGQARILRACDYDFKNKRINIWHPWRTNGDEQTTTQVQE